MKLRKLIIFAGILMAALFLQGCFQDYTVDERFLIKGNLLNKSEQQEIGFEPFDASTFSTMDSRIQNLGTTNPSILVTAWSNLPKKLDQGEHFELWGVKDRAYFSFGKFVESGGQLLSYSDGNSGVTKCATVGSELTCTFSYSHDPTVPVPQDFDSVQVSLEPFGDKDFQKTGGILMSGNVQGLNGLVNRMEFPISFSSGNVFATASVRLFYLDARNGLVTFNQFGFPFLNNGFFYELRALDADLSATVACGAFNVKDGVLVSAATQTPLASNIFKCGTDLTQYRSMIVSIEPAYEGNSKAIFDYVPFKANYSPFTSEGTEDFPIYNLRTSIAGASEDRGLSDVIGNFEVLTTKLGPTYAVFRGLNHEPNYEPVVIDRAKGVTGLKISMIPKIQDQAVFHAFQQDYSEQILSVTVVGNFTGGEAAMNDSGVDGDKVKSDGVWTGRVSGITASTVTYQFRINGKLYNDPHGEDVEGTGSNRGKSIMNIR